MPETAARDLITVEAAAVWANVSARTLYRRIADGTLTAYRFGPKFVRLDRAELNQSLRPAR